MGRCCHRRGSGIGDEVGGAPPVRRLTFARVQRLAPREECALGPGYAHIGADLVNAADALHHVKGRTAFNRTAFLGTDRHLCLQGRGDIELTVPKLHVLTRKLCFAGEARNWIRQVDAAASRAYEAQEEKAASAPSHCHGASKATDGKTPLFRRALLFIFSAPRADGEAMPGAAAMGGVIQVMSIIFLRGKDKRWIDR